MDFGLDDEQGNVDSCRAGEHRAYEGFVAGHVDDTGAQTVSQVQRSEAEIDRDAAAFLFREAIGVDASQRAHEGGLPVVDVTRCSDDHGGPLSECVSQASKAVS